MASHSSSQHRQHQQQHEQQQQQQQSQQSSSPSPSSSSSSSHSLTPPSSSYLPNPPVFSSSFKAVLPPIDLRSVQVKKIRDYRKIDFEDLNKWKFYIYSPLASFGIRCFSHPLSVIKTRMQTSVVHSSPHVSSSASHTSIGSSALPPAPHTQVGAAFPSSASPYNATNTSVSSSTASSKPRIVPYRRIPVDLASKSTFNALSHVVQTEGLRGIYTGFGISIVGLAVGPLYITSLETSRAFFQRSEYVPNSLVAFCAGATASVAAQIVGVPLDVIANRQMRDLPIGQQRKWAPAVVRDIYRQQGLRGFWRGFSLTLLHNAPMSAMVWASFAAIHPRLSLLPRYLAESTTDAKQRFDSWIDPSKSKPNSSSSSSSPNTSSHSSSSSFTAHSTNDSLPAAAVEKWNIPELCTVAVAAAISSSIAAGVTQPLDVIKTRLQVSEKKDARLWTTASDLVRERGYQGLLSGLKPRLAHSAITSASLMTMYEILKRVCIREEIERGHTHQHQ